VDLEGDMTENGVAPQQVPPCVICDGATRRAFRVGEYWIRACQPCGHECAEVSVDFSHVDRVYSDSYFTDGGAGYPGYLREAGLLRARGRRYGRLLRRFASPGTLLDVGAAAGFILQGFADEGWQARGLEPNAGMVRHACERLGLRVEGGMLEGYQVAERFDAVSMIQVIPHFFDVRLALESAATITKPGGIWLVETWNRDSLTRRLTGMRWHEYSPPSVLRWFSDTDLRRLADRFGMSEVGRGRPAKWISGAHAKSLVRSGATAGLASRVIRGLTAVIPDAAPIPYPAEDLFWTVFRKRP
jgi:SAM-dependent methyltransferase